MTRAGLDKKPHEVAAMFDRTARRYDLVNDVMSLGQVRFWRQVVARTVDAGPGEVVLDLAGGTGTSTETFTHLGARAICCDFSLGMLQVGRRRRSPVTFLAGDGLRLPFADGSIDAVTISFGLRNVDDPDTALREMFRVVRPGARLVICEFSRPVVPAFDMVYRRYLLKAIPAIGRLVSSNPDSYEYLAESILDWPDQAALARRIQDAGWSRVAWRNLSLGAVAVHRAAKPVLGGVVSRRGRRKD